MFGGMPPLEAKRLLISRVVTRDARRGVRKLMFLDAKKVHLNPRCEGDEFIELPEECGYPRTWLGN